MKTRTKHRLRYWTGVVVNVATTGFIVAMLIFTDVSLHDWAMWTGLFALVWFLGWWFWTAGGQKPRDGHKNTPKYRSGAPGEHGRW